MRLLPLVALLALCHSLLAAPVSWKPAAAEVETAGDPRFAALGAYRRALVVVRVQTYLKTHQSTPGDEEDILITDFQENVSAREIAHAVGFLKDYPDDEMASELLRFQVNDTSGIWPPWKWLALALFDSCPDVVRRVLPTLSREKQNKFLSDVEFGLSMSAGPGAIMRYPLTDGARDRIRASVAEMRPGR